MMLYFQSNLNGEMMENFSQLLFQLFLAEKLEYMLVKLRVVETLNSFRGFISKRLLNILATIPMKKRIFLLFKFRNTGDFILSKFGLNLRLIVL